MTAFEQAQRYFSDRGVSEETFKRFQAEVVFDPDHDQLVKWLGSNSYSLEAAIVFPNLVPNPDDLSISVHSYYVRCFPPPIGPDGKARKFLSTLGSTYRPYILPPVLDVAFEIDKPIFIVEKQAAALLLWQNELPVISLDGTWGAAAKRIEGETVQLHQVLQEFDWTGRPVHLCFDSDFRSRESVLQGLVRTYILFSIAGAVVKVLQWDRGLKGLDDFIANRAGLDENRQREELDLLVANVSELPAAKAAETWIIPQYRCLFEREIIAISPHMDQRSMLADQIFKALGTTAGDLKKSWRESAKPTDVPGAELIVEDTEPWPEPVSPSEIGDLLLTCWKKHLVTSEVNYWTLVLWQILTHLKDNLSLMPQLGICSAVKRCGKTRTLEVLERTVWKGLLAASVSPAATIRTIEKYEPCFLIDEFDAFLKENEEFRGVLNTCHSRGIKHIRCQPETHEPQAFNAFCAVAIALIGELPSTVEDRAIVLYLKRKQSSQRVMPVRKVPAETFVELRRKIRRFVLDYGKDILDAIPVFPKLSNDRALENWEPLAQIAQILGGDWPYRAFLCAKTLTPSDSDDQSFAIQLLVSLRGLFKACGLNQPGREEEVLPTSKITVELNKDTEARWADRKQYFTGLTAEKLGFELRKFKVRSRRDNKQSGKPMGYCWKDLGPIFLENLGDDASPPPSDPPPSDPTPADPSSDAADLPILEKPPYPGDGPCHSVTDSRNHLSDNDLTVGQGPKSDSVFEKDILDPVTTLNGLETDTCEETGQSDRVQSGNAGVFIKSIPPSTPQAAFCTPSRPEIFAYLDLETFYPFGVEHPQPATYTPGQLAKRQREGKGHPYASDCRRCVIRFLTVFVSDGSLGKEPVTIDLVENPDLPPTVLDAIVNSTLVGHNLDFDVTALRRHGIPVSFSVRDTLISSRLLGLGKQKPKFSAQPYEDLSIAEIEEMELEAEEEDPNPVDHDLASTVRRYFKVVMEKAGTSLGASDWGRKVITPEQRAYMLQDVSILVPLWEAIEPELQTAKLGKVFKARMEFFHHLNEIKMTGIPVDEAQLAEDLVRVEEEKEAEGKKLTTEIFPDLEFEIPKSRKTKIKIKTSEGKTKFESGPTKEGFRPNNRNQHWIPALAAHEIIVTDTRKPTLRRINKPECWGLLKYAAAAKRLSEIKGIVRSIFPDGRVRAENWNQLAAVTGRIVSRGPNLQQAARDYRTGYRVKDPCFWLKADLSQIEMLIIAVVTGDPNMLEMIRAGKDIYVEYGARIFNKKPERGEGEDQITDKLRDIAKKPTLGIFFGQTPWGFVRVVKEELDVEYSIEEAQGFFDQYFVMFPKVAEYYEATEQQAYSAIDVRTVAGTRRWLPPLVGEPSEDWEQNREFLKSLSYRRKILLNTPIQGSGADLVVFATNQFMPRLPSGVEVINLVHDEVDAIVTEATLKRTVQVITKAFQETFAKFYPQTDLRPKIKFSIGPSWGELRDLK